MSDYKSDIDNRSIVIWLVAFGIVVILMLLPLRSYFYEVRNEVVFETVLSVEHPRLPELRAEEQEQLTTYGWVDEEQEIVRIPIDRAMELLIKEAASSGKQGE